MFWEMAQLWKVPKIRNKIIFKLRFLRNGDTVVNSLKICALNVLIDPNSTSRLFKAIFLHSFD